MIKKISQNSTKETWTYMDMYMWEHSEPESTKFIYKKHHFWHNMWNLNQNRSFLKKYDLFWCKMSNLDCWYDYFEINRYIALKLAQYWPVTAWQVTAWHMFREPSNADGWHLWAENCIILISNENSLSIITSEISYIISFKLCNKKVYFW